MTTPIFRRCITGALTLALAFSVLPTVTLGVETDGLCEHHPVHTIDCGYTQSGQCSHSCSQDNGCITLSCSHVHVATCYDHEGTLHCTHQCRNDSACGQPITNCLHTQHGSCGHAEGAPCQFASNGCDTCKEESEKPVTTIKGTDVTIDGYTFPYTGQEIRPEVTVTVDGLQLTEGTHYTLTYKDNLAAGTGSVTVTGLEEAGYDGIVTIPFTIEAPQFTLLEIKGTDVTMEGTKFPYTGEAITPAITVAVDGKTLEEGKDYSVTYENNIQPGTAKVTVKGIATASTTLGYTGEVSISFTIEEVSQKPEQPEDTDKPEDSKEAYTITKGNKATWYMGSGKALSFTANGKLDDFVGISINGKQLDPDLYAVKQGTTVALKTSYLNKLTVGKYTITIHFEDGDAEGSFTVSNRLDTTNPVTGDNTPIGLWILTAMGSLAALGGAAFAMGRKKHR